MALSCLAGCNGSTTADPHRESGLDQPATLGAKLRKHLGNPWRIFGIFGIFGMEPFFWVKGCQSEAVPMACTGVEYVHASEW
jgi:hypothetical protein